MKRYCYLWYRNWTRPIDRCDSDFKCFYLCLFQDESKDIDVVGECEAQVMEVTVTTSEDLPTETSVKLEPPDQAETQVKLW